MGKIPGEKSTNEYKNTVINNILYYWFIENCTECILIIFISAPHSSPIPISFPYNSVYTPPSQVGISRYSWIDALPLVHDQFLLLKKTDLQSFRSYQLPIALGRGGTLHLPTFSMLEFGLASVNKFVYAFSTTVNYYGQQPYYNPKINK